MMASLSRRVLLLVSLAWLVAGFLALGCRKPPDPSPGEAVSGPLLFRDETDRLGLTFRHDPGPIGQHLMPQIMGSGGAFLDFDGDGRLDIYLVHNGGPKGKKNQLFHQR